MIWLKDFRMAGFIVSRGFPISGMKFDARNDVEIGFDDQEEKVTSVLREYGSSPEFRYETSCKFVHDLIRLKIRNR